MKGETLTTTSLYR